MKSAILNDCIAESDAERLQIKNELVNIESEKHQLKLELELAIDERKTLEDVKQFVVHQLQDLLGKIEAEKQELRFKLEREAGEIKAIEDERSNQRYGIQERLENIEFEDQKIKARLDKSLVELKALENEKDEAKLACHAIQSSVAQLKEKAESYKEEKQTASGRYKEL